MYRILLVTLSNLRSVDHKAFLRISSVLNRLYCCYGNPFCCRDNHSLITNDLAFVQYHYSSVTWQENLRWRRFFCSFAHLRMAFRKERNLLGVNSLQAAKELVKLIHGESFSSLGVILKEILYFKNGQFLGDRSSDELIVKVWVFEPVLHKKYSTYQTLRLYL